MACSSLSRAAALALASAVLACQQVPSSEDPEVEEETDTGSTTDEMVTGGPGPNNDSGNGGPEFDCEPADENTCPMGEKCSAVSEGGPQNHYKCVPDDGVLLPGDDCTPAQGTGQDGCTTGHVCLISDVEDQQGRCLQGCQNNDDCEPGVCETSPFTQTSYCADACDPLVPACDPGLTCRQGEDRFICGMGLDETDIGLPGDGCDGVNLRGCAENLACMPGALIPGCTFSWCCTTVCDLGAGDAQCPAPTLCRSLFAMPAPGFETIGACFVPA